MCLKKLFCKDILEENERLQYIVKELQMNIDDLKFEKEELNHTILQLHLQLAQEEVEIEPPEGTEVADTYRGERILVTKDFTRKYPLPYIQDYFLVPKSLVEAENAQAGIIEKDGNFEIFSKALEHVQKKYTYKYDKDQYGYEENWEPIENVIKTKYGDCETLSMLVVMMCRVAGVPADKILMALGIYYDKDKDEEFGHAWVIFNDEKWFLGESTSRVPIKVWSNVADTYFAGWGLGNDKLSLKIKGIKTFL